MPDPTQAATLEPLAPDAFLSDSARKLGAGIGSAGGWAPAASGPLPPIAMSGGIPDPDALPREDLLEAMRAVLAESAPEALRYGGTRGFDGLRAALAERSEREDRVSQSPENFLLTNGCSAVIDLICSTFINPGDVIIAESITYPGTLRTLRGHQARIEPVAIDSDGMVPDDLELVLTRLRAAGTPAKLIYTIADFHNPTGANLSLERRRRVIEIASRHRVVIVEDDAYSEISFESERLPSLYSIAGGEGVLRAGTFSKTIATGLRVGWLQGRTDFVAACDQMRFDMGGSPLVHRMLAEYVGSGRWEEHVVAMRRLYAEKCAALGDAIADECEPYVRFQRPAGGYFLWLTCAEGIDAGIVAKAAAEEGLICVPGRSFFLAGGNSRHLRLAFTTAPLADMPEAARRLRRAFARAEG